MVVKRIFLSFISLSLISVVSPVVQAQDEQDPRRFVSTAPLPADTPEIPSPEQDRNLFVNKSNLHQFQDLLLEPVSAWIDEGRFTLNVKRNLAYLWQLSDTWEEASAANATRFTISQDRTLASQNGTEEFLGSPFNFDEISAKARSEDLAYKILWNVVFAESSASSLLYRLNIAWLNDRALVRKSRGMFYRRFTLFDELSPESKDLPLPERPLRKELLQLFSPPAVYGFSTLAHRFLGPERDRLWVHSPVVGRARRVFQSNRGDPLFGGPLSFDDLFVYSDKLQSLRAKVVADKVLLVPLSP